MTSFFDDSLKHEHSEHTEYYKQLQERKALFVSRIDIYTEIVSISETVNAAFQKAISSMSQNGNYGCTPIRDRIHQQFKLETAEKCTRRMELFERDRQIEKVEHDINMSLNENDKDDVNVFFCMMEQDHLKQLLQKFTVLNQRLHELNEEETKLVKTYDEFFLPIFANEFFAHIENDLMKASKKNKIIKLKDFLTRFPNHVKSREMLLNLLGEQEIEEEKEEEIGNNNKKKKKKQQKNATSSPTTVPLSHHQKKAKFKVAPMASSSCRFDDDDDIVEIDIDLKQVKKLCVEEPPEDLCCPITFVLMNDPVLCSDGFTYEREAIEEWMINNPTSPMARTPLWIVRPNEEKLQCIQLWKSQHRD